MKEIKKVGVLSMAKLQTILMGIFGLIIGIFYAIFSRTIQASEGVDPTSGLGWIVVIIFPIMYAIIGFVVGIVASLLYNLIARWVCGIKIELSK